MYRAACYLGTLRPGLGSGSCESPLVLERSHKPVSVTIRSVPHGPQSTSGPAKTNSTFIYFFSFINAGSSCVSKQSIYVSLKWLARPIEQTNENKQMYWPLSQWLSEASVLICSWTQTKKGLIWMKDSCILYVYFHSNKCSCLPSVFSSHSIIPITPRQHLSCC